MARTRWVLAGFTAAALAVAVPAGADPLPAAPATTAAPTGAVVVGTKDGAVYRGVVVERIPGQYVALQLVTGEVRRIPWDAIATETASVQPGPVAAPLQPMGKLIRVSFRPDSDNAQLERQISDKKWDPIRVGACAASLDTGAVYRVGGRGIRRSQPFRLPADRPGIGIETNVGTTSQTVWGIVLLVGGAGAGALGLMLLALGGIDDSIDNRNRDSELTTTGLVFGVGGVAAMVGGIVLLSNNKTQVNLAGKRSLSPVMKLPGGIRLEQGAFVF